MTKLQSAEYHAAQAALEILWLDESDELLRADELLNEARVILGRLRLAEHNAKSAMLPHPSELVENRNNQEMEADHG